MDAHACAEARLAGGIGLLNHRDASVARILNLIFAVEGHPVEQS
jgi:hypothetical protein